MPASLTTRARAKVNLDLLVLGRRADGYHELDSVVAFAGIGDELSLDPEGPLGLTISGPRRAGLHADADNLVLRAAGAFLAACPGSRAGAFHLVKRLPVASGIGGGSADAAAALRLLARLNDVSPVAPTLGEIAAGIGADVPVCLESRARVMSGVGEGLGPVLRPPPLPALLVNPGVPVETVAVFKALGLSLGERHGPGREADAAPPRTQPEWLRTLSASRNDLEPPALRVAPIVAQVLGRLRGLPGCHLARMSGSGATCFALFDTWASAREAARGLTREQPDWWVRSTVLR
jgi:4-diphosphocytidyl-2-C-methyl-D-erythritol kinase